MGRLRLALVVAWTVPRYWIAIFPLARRELRRLERRASAIPDPALRAHALHKLRTEHLTAEGAAAFAILATRRHRRDVARACVLLEAAYDYLDALGEDAGEQPLLDNLRLYDALDDAVSPDGSPRDHYALHPQCDDGGYLRDIVERCRASLARLPAADQVRPALRRHAARAAIAQSLYHATPQVGEAVLARWAERQQPSGADLRWWELAAAAGSPLSFFALIAAASQRETTVHDATRIADAYFPWIAALSWLLESLVDQDVDARSDSLGYVTHYGSPAMAGRRLAIIAERARRDAGGLRHGGRHVVLLAGMVGMYLSHAGASSGAAVDTAEAVRNAIGGPVPLLVWLLRLRRRCRPRRRALRLRGEAVRRT